MTARLWLYGAWSHMEGCIADMKVLVTLAPAQLEPVSGTSNVLESMFHG